MADAFNLARAGRLNYSIALSLTGYMRNEVDYIPWKSMETYSHFDDDPLRVYAQAIAFKLACHFKHRDCIRNASTLFLDWMENPEEQ